VAWIALALLLAVAYLLGRSQGGPGSPRTTPPFEEFRDRIFQSGIFSGGPDVWFEDVGRRTLAKSIECGLMPDDVVLDIGAGALRVGWWLVQYVRPQNYHAVEPVRERIDTAAEILGADIHVHYNDDFEFPDVEFDFVLARSIWTHAAKWMISKMLSEFVENSPPDGVFLASVLPAASEDEDYDGEEWVGKVLKTDPSAGVKHSLEWIRAECDRHGLTFEIVGELHDQIWLLISRE
jgi:hypothetical protein